MSLLADGQSVLLVPGRSQIWTALTPHSFATMNHFLLGLSERSRRNNRYFLSIWPNLFLRRIGVIGHLTYILSIACESVATVLYWAFSTWDSSSYPCIFKSRLFSVYSLCWECVDCCCVLAVSILTELTNKTNLVVEGRPGAVLLWHIVVIVFIKMARMRFSMQLSEASFGFGALTRRWEKGVPMCLSGIFLGFAGGSIITALHLSLSAALLILDYFAHCCSADLDWLFIDGCTAGFNTSLPTGVYTTWMEH